MTRQRLTDAEFDALKRARDQTLSKIIDDICAKNGWDRSKVVVHCSDGGGTMGDCYCACPDGPCQHIWDGPDFVDETTVSATCSRCGMPAFSHDLRCMP